VEYFIVAENDVVVRFGSREHDWPGGRFRGFDAPAGTYVRDTAFAYRLVAGRIAERRAIRATSQCSCNSVQFVHLDRSASHHLVAASFTGIGSALREPERA
jgi:hypothetical protein